jgi:hypothetical protein
LDLQCGKSLIERHLHLPVKSKIPAIIISLILGILAGPSVATILVLRLSFLIFVQKFAIKSKTSFMEKIWKQVTEFVKKQWFLIGLIIVIGLMLLIQD